MDKQEFIDFCHVEFTKRGFVKKKTMYYLKGKDLMCGMYLQKSMGEAFYVEFNFYIGNYFDVKSYPKRNESDIYRRIAVLSKDTYNGEHFMDTCIEYGRYKEEEIEPYFDQVFDKYIMPPILEGKEYIIKNQDYYFEVLFPEELERVLSKLRQKTGDGSVS